MTDVVDLLAALREGTRRGAGREVDLTTQPQALEAPGRVANPTDDGKSQDALRLDREAQIRSRLAAGTHSEADVAWIRGRLRTPRALTDAFARVGCDGCSFNEPVRYAGVVVAESRCELDRVCWKAESAAAVVAEQRPPLWVLRLPDGKPNYRDASEMERYLREAGWLAWSAGARKGPDAGATVTSGERAKKVEWPVPWETYMEQVGDVERIPPENADVRLLADWQREYVPSARPIEKLAEVEVGPSPWRHWDGPKGEVEPCATCGEPASYSVAGVRYCRDHARGAETAQKRGVPVEEEIDIDIETEVAA